MQPAASTHYGAEPPASGWAATVLIVCYRMRDTVLEALHGALAQTVPCEIIVSDDSSGDGTLAAVQTALQGYAGPHRVIVRGTPRNLGLCPHLQELVAIASAPVVFNSAGDDVSMPDRVATAAEGTSSARLSPTGNSTSTRALTKSVLRSFTSTSAITRPLSISG